MELLSPLPTCLQDMVLNYTQGRFTFPFNLELSSLMLKYCSRLVFGECSVQISVCILTRAFTIFLTLSVQMLQWLLSCKSFAIHYSPITPSLDSILQDTCGFVRQPQKKKKLQRNDRNKQTQKLLIQNITIVWRQRKRHRKYFCSGGGMHPCLKPTALKSKRIFKVP
jgi:hypothetical protein